MHLLRNSTQASSLFLLIILVGCAGNGSYQNGKDALDRGDYEIAYQTWLSLAEKGNVEAQNGLGYMYANSIIGTTSYSKGYRMDNIYAYMWWSIAASHGHELAWEGMASLSQGTMNQDQIEQAKKLALECKAKNYKDC